MDPIHPIIPETTTPAPVVPAPRTAAVSRDGSRDQAASERRRREARRGARHEARPGTGDGELDLWDDEGDAGADTDEPPPRLDVSA